MRQDLARAENQNEALVRELSALHQGSARMTPELASQTYSLRQITLGRGTGGYDADDSPGDEALQVVLEPRDGDGHTIKAPGSLHVEALEVSVEGLKTPLSAWDISPEELRATWKGGLWSTGYFLVLHWQNWPSSERVRVIARFTLTDGRVFEADKDVQVRLTPVSKRKEYRPLKPAQPIPDGGELLPSPKKVDPKGGTSENGPGIIPATSASRKIQPAAMWQPVPEASVAESVQLLRPVPLNREPGEDPEQ
jgi:hypothetical protein